MGFIELKYKEGKAMFTEYRIIAIKDGEITELESGYTNREQAEAAAKGWAKDYSDYKIMIEEY